MSADDLLPRESPWPSFSALTNAVREVEGHLWGVRWLHPDAGVDALDAAAMRFVEERLDEHRMLLSEATGYDGGAESTRFEVSRSANEAADRWSRAWEQAATTPWLDAFAGLAAKCIPRAYPPAWSSVLVSYDGARRSLRRRSPAWSHALRTWGLGAVGGENLLRAHLGWLYAYGPGRAAASPFWPLLAMCERGIWPVRLRDDGWLVYAPRIEDDALVLSPEATVQRAPLVRVLRGADSVGRSECAQLGLGPPGIDRDAPALQPPSRVVVVEYGHRRAPLDLDVVKIGRAATSHLRLDDNTAARMHCVLEISRDACTAIDLGATLGTQLDGADITKAALRDGSVLQLSTTALRFTFERAEP